MATTNDEIIGITTERCLGIVTRLDLRHYYVWTSRLGTAELKYARNATTSIQFRPGEIVTFVQSLPVNSVQLACNLFKCDDQRKSLIRVVESSPNSGLPFHFKAETLLSFAYVESAFFNGVMEKDDEDRVQAVAWSDDFKLVVSFVEDIKYDVGAVYKAWVARIPAEQTSFGTKIGTLFFVIGTDMTEFEVTDKQTVDEFLEKCPWNKQFVKARGLDHSRAEEMGLQEGTSQQQDFSQNEQESAFFEEEPLADTYIQASHNEGEQHIGIIVRREPDCSIIWSAKHDVVCIPIGSGYDKMGENAPISLAAWVHFHCIPEENHLLRGGLLCQHTAYDIKKAIASRKTILIKNETVAVNMTIKNARAHSTQFLLADTVDFGGKTTTVLCSCKDGMLRERMCAEDSIDMRVEVFSMYTEQYKFSKWVAIAMWDQAVEDFIGIQGLPASIEAKVGNFFRKPPAMQPKTTHISTATSHANDGATFQHDDFSGNPVDNEPKEEQPKNDDHLFEDAEILENHQFGSGSFSSSTSADQQYEMEEASESMVKQVQKQPHPQTSRKVGLGGRQSSSFHHAHDQQQLPLMLLEQQKPMEEPIVADLIDFGSTDWQQIQTAPNEEGQKMTEKKLEVDTGGPSSSAGPNTKKQPTVGPKFFEMLAGEQAKDGETGAANKVEAGKLKHLLAEFWEDDGK